MPFATKGSHQRLSGRDSIASLFRAWSEDGAVGDLVSDLIFYSMQDPEMVLVEINNATSTLAADAKRSRKSIGLFHVDNGKIMLLREYSLTREMK